ncbi:MAG TPA: translation elongation factor Ts [Candidatus Dormibacteraeota bacterium]
MTEITPRTIKQLRDMTGAGMMDCKKAMEAAEGDLEKAVVWLREQGIAKAAKRQDRVTSNGVVEAYLHRTGDYPPQTGALIELDCESDFVAKGDEFRTLAREIALHVAAAAPRWISREEVPAEVIAQEKEVALEQARNEGRPEAAWDKIVEGRLNNFYKETVLLEQAYVREPKTTIENLIKEQIAKLQENITVRRFARYNVKE